jgi:hypothetical protein
MGDARPPAKDHKRGADIRPDFNWNQPTVALMGYR